MTIRIITILAAIMAVIAQPPLATLTGFAVLPADTFAEGPPSGAWLRGDTPGKPQFSSQPVQGVSALLPISGQHWWALSDNGYGSKLNSPDYLLRIYRMTTEWGSSGNEPGRVTAGPFIPLADPHRRLPFRIVREATPERWLTGADLDPESFVRMPDGTFWIGDEFGPFLLHFAADGTLRDPPYEVPGLRSPDHPHAVPADAGQTSMATAGRSRGFEGLAHFGEDLYAAIEGGIGADAGAARIYEFDLTTRAFTPQSWRIELTSAQHAFSEFVSLAHLGPPCASRFLAIERDGGHGVGAKLKHVREIQLAGNSAVSQVVADLLAIGNPQRIGGQSTTFTFPFITTEAVWATSRTELVLANDNNFPAGGGRPGAARDHTEFIRLALATPLCSR